MNRKADLTPFKYTFNTAKGLVKLAAMSQPKISIIHICYNQSPHIRTALKAVFAQSYAPLEIVISDDCSTDNTFEIIKEEVAAYTGSHKIILNCNAKNLGIVGNVNHAVSLSSGAFIVQVNGDDICQPNRVAAMVAEWQSAPDRIKMVFSRLEQVDESGARLRLISGSSFSALDAPPSKLVLDNAYVIGAGVAFSRELFDVFGPIPSVAQVEDHILPFRARCLGEIRKIDEPLLKWRIGGLSWTDQNTRAHPRNFYFGQRVDMMRRLTSNQEAFLIDLERVEIANKKLAVQRCKRNIMRMRFLETILPIPAYLLAVGILPAYALTLWRLDRFYARITIIYALRPLVFPFRLWRYNRAKRLKGNAVF